MLRKQFLKLGHKLGRHPEKLTPRNLLLETLMRFQPRAFASELIRIGGPRDGGYLLPDDVSDIEYVISPGVGSSVEFEVDLLNRFGTKSILIDPTVTRDPEWPEELTFLPKFLGSRNTNEYVDLDLLLDEFRLRNKILMLQMDIEGFEYEVLLRTSRTTLQEFKILVIELHDLNLWIRKELFNRHFLPAINNLFLDFVPIHLHANNAGGWTSLYGIKFPNTIELTLVNNDNSNLLDGSATLPHPLDARNIDGSDLQLPFELIEKLLLKTNLN